jgi:hypothetical protein
MSGARREAGVDWARMGVEFRAVSGFYRSLGEQARRAARGEALPPVVPPNDELAFVGEFLVWKGRPVWWTGEPADPALTQGLEAPGLVDPELVSRPLPAPKPRRRGVSRFLHALGLI